MSVSVTEAKEVIAMVTQQFVHKRLLFGGWSYEHSAASFVRKKIIFCVYKTTTDDENH